MEVQATILHKQEEEEEGSLPQELEVVE